MFSKGSSRTWLLGGLLAVLGLCLMLWLQRRAAPETSVARPVAPSPSRPTAPAPAPERAAAKPPATEAAAPASDELCGVSAVAQQRAPGESVEQQVARLTEPAIARWRKDLLESAKPRQRAVGLALRNASPGMQAAPEAAAPDTPSDNELVLLATEADDPAIYALALGQCGEGDSDLAAGPCQGLSLEHWAKMEPDNAEPWLWVATRADAAGNRAKTDEALGHAAAASRLESYAGAMSAIALAALSPQVTPLEKAVAGAELVSIARYVTPLALVVRLCSPEALRENTRRKQCGALANLLASQGSTLIEVSMAWRLAERLGRPRDEWIGLQNEQRSYTHALSHPWASAEVGGGFGCQVVKRYDYFIDQLAAKGNERAAMKATAELARRAGPEADGGATPSPVPGEDRSL